MISMKSKRKNKLTGFPSEIQIKSRTWTIHYVDPTHPMLLDKKNEDDKGTELLGSCIESTREIYVDNSQSLETLKDTLIHEIMHACYRSSPGLPASEKAEESIVMFSTEAFFEITRNLKTPFWGARFKPKKSNL